MSLKLLKFNSLQCVCVLCVMLCSVVPIRFKIF